MAKSSPATGGSRISALRVISLVVPPLVVMALIFFLSAQPNDGEDRALWELVLRKVGHVTEYLVLTLATWRAVRGLRPSWGIASQLIAAVLVGLLYAVSDEIHQTFVEGRHGTPVDVLIDAIGMTLAALLVLRRYADRRRRTLGPSRPSAA